MGSALYVKLDRAGRLIRDMLDNEGPLPMDVEQLLLHAYDDVEQARGHERTYPPGYGKKYLNKFSPGDLVSIMLNSGLRSTDIEVPVAPVILSVKIIEPPKRRSPQDHEDMGGGKQWYFTSDLPASTTAQVDATMHVEGPSDIREVFHLRTEHWSRWREKSGEYWSIWTILPEN
jgi:hypothetical protein